MNQTDDRFYMNITNTTNSVFNEEKAKASIAPAFLFLILGTLGNVSSVSFFRGKQIATFLQICVGTSHKRRKRKKKVRGSSKIKMNELYRGLLICFDNIKTHGSL